LDWDRVRYDDRTGGRTGGRGEVVDVDVEMEAVPKQWQK
jgi:hypothetical protein